MRSEQQISAVIKREREELARRKEKYFRGRSPVSADNKEVILVDDGIATGATMRAAIEFVRKGGAKRVIVAVPVATPESESELKPLVESFICPLIPDNFSAVGQFYESFDQVSDEEVLALLESSER